MNNEYEAYVLSVGDFDERVFLGSEADEEIGTPTKYRDEGTGELAERLQMKANLQQHIDEVSLSTYRVMFGYCSEFKKIVLWLFYTCSKLKFERIFGC